MSLHNQLAIIFIVSGIALMLSCSKYRRLNSRRRRVLGAPSDRCKRNGPEALP